MQVTLSPCPACQAILEKLQKGRESAKLRHCGLSLDLVLSCHWCTYRASGNAGNRVTDVQHALPHRKRTVGGILRTPEGKIDYTQDFFEKPSYLTVSGQLNAEYYACALSNVYTFGPTFRSAVHSLSPKLFVKDLYTGVFIWAPP